MNSDFRKAMEQRRRRSEAKVSEPPSGGATPHSPTKKKLSKVAMGSDLQAIMARRRKMAGDTSGDEGDGPPPSKPQPDDLASHLTDKPSSRRGNSNNSSNPITKPPTTAQDVNDEGSVDGSVISSKGRPRRKNRRPDQQQQPPQQQQQPPQQQQQEDGSSHHRRTNRRRGKDSDDQSVDYSVSSGRSSEQRGAKNTRRRRKDDDSSQSSAPKPASKRTPKSPDGGSEDDPDNSKKGARRKKQKAKPPQRKEGDDADGKADEGGGDATAEVPSPNEPEAGNNLEEKPEPSMSGWGDFPAFGSGSGGGKTDDGFAGFPADSNFGSTGDTAFGGFDALATHSSGNNTNDGNKSLSTSDFDAAFSTNAFGSGGTSAAFDAAFDTSTTAAFSTAFGESAFGGAAATVEAPPAKVWDKTPLSGDLPNRFLQKPVLSQSVTLKFESSNTSATDSSTQQLLWKPVVNPLNANLIFARATADGVFLHEIDPRRQNLQIMCTPVLTSELKRKIAAKYHASVYKVDHVLALSAGLHHTNSQSRARVAAIVDLRVLEAKQVLRIVAVWQWGYGTAHPATLQYTISPPSGGDFLFDATSLVNADGLLFLAGSSPKGPCVFMCKPSLKETWSANFLAAEGKIACLAVPTDLRRKFPYLAVALRDGALSIWTYAPALLTSSKENTNEKSKRWLLPLCRLAHASALSSVDPTAPSEVGIISDHEFGEVGHCTKLLFLPPQPSFSSLPLIAAAFQNGFAVFHLTLPVLEDKNSKSMYKPLPEPTGGTTLLQVPPIGPMVAKRWQGKHEKSDVAWITVSPHQGPCLALLLHENKDETGTARLVMGMVTFPGYKKTPVHKDRLVSFRIFASLVVPSDSPRKPTGLLLSTGLCSLSAYSRKHMLRFSISDPSVTTADSEGMTKAIGLPATSMPSGLSTFGETLLVDSQKDGILHIHTSIHCERKRVAPDSPLLEWARPMVRHWLCQTKAGDTKTTSYSVKDSEEEVGGADSDVLCELFREELAGYAPMRIVRYRHSSFCAVTYRRTLGNDKENVVDVSLDASLVAFVDWSGPTPGIDVLRARDVAFLPAAEGRGPQGVLLSFNGSTLTHFEWDATKKSCKLGSACKPIVGVEVSDDEEFVDCRRIFAFEGADKVVLAAVATRTSDDRSCVIIGDLSEAESITKENWSVLLPNIETDRSCFFEKYEEVVSVVGLEGDDSGYRNFGVCTSSRVIVLSSALTISAQAKISEPVFTLSPLGAFAFGYVSSNRLNYLCCLDKKFAWGSICSFPLRKHGYSLYTLGSIRPDRAIVFESHSGVRLVELGQNADSFLLPTAKTFPALLLEPLVANAVCVGGKENQSTPVLRVIVEKFGRKVASITHGDQEGIGPYGAGISARVYEILGKYGLKDASMWLLTGTVNFERSANSRVLPPWLPISNKMLGTSGSDAFLHLISSGDQYFSDYLKSPDQNMASTLPRQSDPSVYLARAFAEKAMQDGKASDIFKTLDLAGTQTTENLMVQLALVHQRGESAGATDFLKHISGFGEKRLGGATAAVKPSAALSALAVFLKESGSSNKQMSSSQIKEWITPLAPSLQRGARVGRARQRLISEQALQNMFPSSQATNDTLWQTPCSEAKHIWNEGPHKQKENLLMLDRMEDWMGRRRPYILGKQGAAAARDRGEKTLADILNQGDDDSFGGESDLESEKDNWVEGVGEGRSDEANLSAYFRMSEGEDEDNPWKTEGLQDISPYQNKMLIVGDTAGVTLQESTSSVDEGVPGKVKSLYDLVFVEQGLGAASGLALPSTRGCSVDVGILHGQERESRKRCSVEFWFHVASELSNDMVLMRRTMGGFADELSKICLEAEHDCAAWEVLLLKSGELEFRSCGGSSVVSSQKFNPNEQPDDDPDYQRPDKVVWGRWNHVCITLSSKGLGVTECSMSMYMKGVDVASSDVSMLPAGYEEGDLEGSGTVDEIMQKSHLVFGLNHPAAFRMTELRIWACERSADDTHSFMYEYLTAAEQKKKFKVKISNKNKGAGKTKAGGLGAPKGVERRQSFVATTKQPGKLGSGLSKGLSLAPPPKGSAFSLAPAPRSPKKPEKPKAPPAAFSTSFTSFDAKPSSFAKQSITEEEEGEEERDTPLELVDETPIEETPDDEEGEDLPATLWDTALPLSKQIRSSAAAALIRGPPATRHFGGNRGGLPDFSGMERFGVGGIAICGSEKTIVWRDNEDPPALTYPIGASGAVVSDQMDETGSEFLCCFLARERRMIVFELQSRTVVVELQMTTKLNFWRYLPPEAAENTLCFMLVTPVGGFHWMPLEESPRPHQVWKRGPDLQGKKVVSYEEGGSNGFDDSEIRSKVGLVMVTKESGGGTLEAWIVPINGDSRAVQVSDDVMGACLSQPPFVEEGPFLPLLVTVHNLDEGIYVNVLSINEIEEGSIELGEIEVSHLIELAGFEDIDLTPPSLAMGTFPEAICCSLSNIIVVVVRRKGLIAAFELEDDDLSLIAQEGVGHYVVDAVMRYSAEVGGAEIVMMLSDNENQKDGRIVSFCFRSAA